MHGEKNNRHLSGDPLGERELLGSILLKRGKITEEELKEALEVQEKKDALLGEILVELGYVEELDIVVAVILQCGLPYIAVNKYHIDRQALKLIPADIARRFHVIALDSVGEVLSVVMSDPLNRTVVQKLEELTKYKIAPFIATKTEIDEAINHWYHKKNE